MNNKRVIEKWVQKREPFKHASLSGEIVEGIPCLYSYDLKICSLGKDGVRCISKEDAPTITTKKHLSLCKAALLEAGITIL